MARKYQDNIVNPFYNENAPAGYDYSTPKNRWIIAGIHSAITVFYTQIQVGYPLLSGGPIPENTSLTEADLLAYAALYPQNVRYNRSSGELVFLTKEEQTTILEQIGARIKRDDPESSGLTLNLTSTTVRNSLNVEPRELKDPRQLTPLEIGQSLLSFSEDLSTLTMQNVRAAFRTTLSLDSSVHGFTFASGSVISTLGNFDVDIDYYDWVENVTPPRKRQTTYYNPNDKSFYYTKRTNQTDPSYYDIGNDESVPHQEEARREGVSKILKSMGKYSNDIRNRVLENPANVTFSSSLDPRPSSRWIYGVWIRERFLDDLVYGRIGEADDVEDLSPTQKLQILKDTEKIYPNHRVRAECNRLQGMVTSGVQILNNYRSILTAEGITPEMLNGFNISEAIRDFQTFMTCLSSILEAYGIDEDFTADSKSLIEFSFGKSFIPQSITYNGIILTKGFGVNPVFFAEEQESRIATVDFFSTCNATTFALMYYLPEIVSQYSLRGGEQLPWSEFFDRYIFPKIKISPSEIQRKQDLNRGLLRSTNNIFQRADSLVSFQSAELNRAFWDVKNAQFATLSALEKEIGGCSTTQSNLAKQIIPLVRSIQAKDWTSIIKQVVHVLRDEVVQDQTAKEVLTLGTEPRRAQIMAEKWVNEQLSCALGQLEGALIQAVLPSNINPGNGRILHRPPATHRAIAFNVGLAPGKENSMFLVWQKTIKMMLTKLSRQLLLAALRDIIGAALGCRDKAESSGRYGLINLNAYVFREIPPGEREALVETDMFGGTFSINIPALEEEERTLQQQLFGDTPPDESSLKPLIPIIKIAEDLGMTNKEVAVVDGERRVITSPPLKGQLLALNWDVSRMVTPEELSSLLAGNADENVLGALIETINNGDVDLDGLTEQQKRDPVIRLTRQESFESGDTRYAVLGIDQDTLKLYLNKIGDELSKGDKDSMAFADEDNLTPIQRFCGPLEQKQDKVSDAQVLSELDLTIDQKMRQIKDLCEFGNSENPWDMALNDFWNDVPGLEQWDKILEAISSASNFLASFLPDFQFEFANVEGLSTVDKFEHSRTGKEIIFGAPSTVNSVLAPQVKNIKFRGLGDAVIERPAYVTPNTYESFEGYAEDDFNSRNYIQLAGTRQSLPVELFGFEISSTEQYIPCPGYSGNEVNTARSLVESASPRQVALVYDEDEAIVYQTFPEQGEIEPQDIIARFSLAAANQGNASAFSLRNRSNIQGGSTNPRLTSTTVEEIREQINNLFLDGVANENSRLLSNPVSSGFKLLDGTLFSTRGRKRSKKFSAAIYKDPYKFLDPCLPHEDMQKIEAINTAILVRLRRFLLNVLPLMPAYGAWGTPDTENMVVDYLKREFTKDLRVKGMFGLIMGNMDLLQQQETTYGDNLVDMFRGKTADEQFREYIRVSYRTLLQQMTDGESYVLLDTLFTGNSLSKYSTMTDFLYNRIGDRIDIPRNDPAWDTAALYYMPAPLLIGIEILACDKCYDYITAIDQLAVTWGRQIAAADDNLSTAFSGINEMQWMTSYTGAGMGLPGGVSFPYTSVFGKVYGSAREMDTDLKYLEFLESYIDVFDNFITPLTNLRAIITGHLTTAEQLARQDLDNFQEVLEDWRIFDPDRTIPPDDLGPVGSLNPVYWSGWTKWWPDTFPYWHENGISIREVFDSSVAMEAHINERLPWLMEQTRDHLWYSKYPILGEAGIADIRWASYWLLVAAYGANEPARLAAISINDNIDAATRLLEDYIPLYMRYRMTIQSFERRLAALSYTQFQWGQAYAFDHDYRTEIEQQIDNGEIVTVLPLLLSGTPPLTEPQNIEPNYPRPVSPAYTARKPSARLMTYLGPVNNQPYETPFIAREDLLEDIENFRTLIEANPWDLN
jgi:hypothetical protein